MKLKRLGNIVWAIPVAAALRGKERPAERHLYDSVVDTAFITCKPYTDACKADPACPVCSTTGNNAVTIIAGYSCDANLAGIQKVRLVKGAVRVSYLV